MRTREEKIEYLKSCSTHHLLKLLQHTRVDGGYDRDYDWTDGMIKSVLATRPHIMNKKEGEQHRRNRAKTRKDARNNKYRR